MTFRKLQKSDCELWESDIPLLHLGGMLAEGSLGGTHLLFFSPQKSREKSMPNFLTKIIVRNHVEIINVPQLSSLIVSTKSRNRGCTIQKNPLFFCNKCWWAPLSLFSHFNCTHGDILISFWAANMWALCVLSVVQNRKSLSCYVLLLVQ